MAGQETRNRLRAVTKFAGEEFGVDKVRTVFVGSAHDEQKRSDLVVVLIGLSGAGKSSLIDAVCNYFYGVTQNSIERFKIADEHFDTKTPLTAITKYVFNGTRTDYRPVFFDTPGIASNGDQPHQVIADWLSCNPRLHIDLLALVLPSAQSRLNTQSERQLTQLLALFPTSTRLNVLLTGSDGSTPPAGNLLRSLQLQDKPVFLFNTNALYTPPEEDPLNEQLRTMYWEMNTDSLKRLLVDDKTDHPHGSTSTGPIASERRPLRSMNNTPPPTMPPPPPPVESNEPMVKRYTYDPIGLRHVQHQRTHQGQTTANDHLSAELPTLNAILAEANHNARVLRSSSREELTEIETRREGINSSSFERREEKTTSEHIVLQPSINTFEQRVRIDGNRSLPRDAYRPIASSRMTRGDSSSSGSDWHFTPSMQKNGQRIFETNLPSPGRADSPSVRINFTRETVIDDHPRSIDGHAHGHPRSVEIPITHSTPPPASYNENITTTVVVQRPSVIGEQDLTRWNTKIPHYSERYPDPTQTEQQPISNFGQHIVQSQQQPPVPQHRHSRPTSLQPIIASDNDPRSPRVNGDVRSYPYTPDHRYDNAPPYSDSSPLQAPIAEPEPYEKGQLLTATTTTTTYKKQPAMEMIRHPVQEKNITRYDRNRKERRDRSFWMDPLCICCLVVAPLFVLFVIVSVLLTLILNRTRD